MAGLKLNGCFVKNIYLNKIENEYTITVWIGERTWCDKSEF